MEQHEQGPVGGVTAHLTIRDNRAADAIDFYSRAFGAEEIGRHMADDGNRIMHAHLNLNGASLMLNDDFPEYGGAATPPGSVTLHL
jgi:PhnB protein